MANYRPNVPPSPNPSIQSDRRRPRPDSVRASRNSLARQSTGSSIYGYLVGGREIEATKILDVLQKGIVILSGGRDPQGGPLITFPANGKRGDFSPTDIATCLKYLAQIPSEEYKRRGFSIVIDSRDGSWSNLVTVLGCLKQSLGEYLKQVFVIQAEYDRRNSLRRERPSVNIEPLFVSVPKLHEYIDRAQLTTDIGGFLPYNQKTWLQNRLDLERFLQECQDVVQHLDQEEVRIQQTYSHQDPQMSPIEALRQHRYFQESIMVSPQQVISSGKDLLNRLQYDSSQSGFRSEDEVIPTLDNLEAQKQTKRVIQYLENRVEKLQDFLDDRDKYLNLSMKYSEWKRKVKSVVDWVLGPPERSSLQHRQISETRMRLQKISGNVMKSCRSNAQTHMDSMLSFVMRQRR
ncbi:SEC14 domain and spectrin repeat-containing protein 1-like [Haliotis rubra]|uniref:SEC14 domain and spectrin repeat-containing protein 1-like n=1 Tax=Haliotis rubra TaxID=36100 RepID=UPI001EE5F3A0|nr:SEC14 domain and spectrin repeat-containing protein 1-like [Haliotis rubra]